MSSEHLSHQGLHGIWPAVGNVACAALGPFLLRQRWYPAKDAGPPAVTLLSLSPVACRGLAAAVALWKVTPPGQSAMTLFVPLVLLRKETLQQADSIATVPAEDGDYALVDAFSSDEFVRAWVEVHLDGRGAGPAELRSGRPEHPQQRKIELNGTGVIHRLDIDQSNTSIRIGEDALLKIFRKLEQGVHPELEVGRFLSGAGFRAMPALLGWVEHVEDSGERSITFSVLHEFVRNQGDGWQWMLDQLARGAGRGEEGAFATTLEWIKTLAQRVAAMHGAFAAAAGDPDFNPEPVTEHDVQEWAEAARAMLSRAWDSLITLAPGVGEAVQALAARVLPQRAELESQLDELARHPPGFNRTRHHGDLHLGQVLVVGPDAMILDFEGEPLRPLAERRAKHAVLRDVAGLLRSFSYVAEAATRALPPDLTDSRRQAACRRLNDWRTEAARLFTRTYLCAAEGLSSVPRAPAEAQRVLRFFLLEKALYEIVYEATHRPDWLSIPLSGLLELLSETDPDNRCAHHGPCGAEILEDGSVRFRVWAPAQSTVSVELDNLPSPIPMQRLEEGWHELITRNATVGSLYRYRLMEGIAVPDPASRFQPHDVHGPSEVIDPKAYRWRDADWRGRPWEEAVVYELHVGVFTPDGTFRAAIERLDHLVKLGVTAVEIMPIADFPGSRNWGYDGVSLYAPDAAYGRPEALKELIDAAHARGLMVLLDVVYNHFGPEGAYIHTIAPQTFTDRHKTPWGGAINFDARQARPVREFFIHNALYWLEEFHFDGLRLDAVHAIADDSSKHLLEELAERLRAAVRGRHIHLVLENEENQACRLARDADGQPRWYSAQWNDDVHHVLHVAATAEATGYYADYHGETARLGRALAEGFAFQGELMRYRGSARGQVSKGLPPVAFVAFIQNHDQIGNRALGERITQIAPAAAARAIAAVYLLLPQVPMLFMGEEWGAVQPFPFFCDFEPALAEAVRNGRRAEFARFPEFEDPALRERIPDPTAMDTFLAAKLNWADLEQEPHSSCLQWYQRLLALRHRELVPRLDRIRAAGRFEVVGENAVVVRWIAGEAEWVLEANLHPAPAVGFSAPVGRVIWTEGEIGADGCFGPHTVRWSLTEIGRV